MRTVPIGTRGTFAMVVAPEHLANRFKDAMLPGVLATPVMIMAMENAALNAIKPWFDPGESAVGTRVDVEHRAATPPGRRIVAHAEVTRVDGRRLEFRVNAMDGDEEKYLLGSIEERHDDLEVMSPGSPLGELLLGREAGYAFTYTTPTGYEMPVEILAVE